MSFSVVSRFIVASGCLLVGLLWLSGCSSTGNVREDPDALYKLAEEEFQDENYLIALEKFREVKNRFPYSSRAKAAELRIADTYYAQESYIEAAGAYEVFAELHPTYDKIDYVNYRIGMSFFQQIPGNIARDLSAAHKAIQAFDKFLSRHPKSQYVKQAQTYRRTARTKLAEHESYVANFYYQRMHYLSSSYRYASLIQNYPKLGFDEEALYRLGECYYHIRMYANARDTLGKLLKQYPGSAYASNAKDLLNKLTKSN